MRLGPWEIDLVARRGDLVVIVEVRTRGRGSQQGPFESVSGRKRLLLKKAARRLWREKLVKLAGVERVRIDVAAVWFDAEPPRVEYVEGAIT